MTPSELKANVEKFGNKPYFFTCETMRFFGDTMRFFGDTMRPVKHGLQPSAYFSKADFRRVYPKQ